MTPTELRQIANEADPSTMAEALRQWADEMSLADPLYQRIVDTTLLTPMRASVLALLWRQRGHVVSWERLASTAGLSDAESVQSSVLKHLRRAARDGGWGIEVRSAPRHGQVLVQTGPVPWE